MDLEVMRALASDDGRTAIDAAVAALAAGADELSVVNRLRRALDAPVAAAVLTQAQLRPRAAAKLGGRAGDLLLLPDSLEQASRPEVSAVRAQRLLDAGVTRVVDAGAGLGADSIAYAEAGLQVTAVERDPLVAEVLRHNAEPFGVHVIEGDAIGLLHSGEIGRAEGTAVYVDPARRSNGRRLFDPEECTPPLSVLVELADAGVPIVAKMSPSLGVDDVPAGWDADWVSTQTEHGRSVVEASIWSPLLAKGSRRAVVLLRSAAGDTWDRSDLSSEPATGTPSEPVAGTSSGPVARYVYEPDGAVNQAEVVDELAAILDGWLIEPRIAYLTSDLAVDTPFAHRYRVVDQLPWSKRALARRLASIDASDLVIKKRGVTVDPTALRRQLLPRLRSRTGAPLVVILSPHAGRVVALLAHAA